MYNYTEYKKDVEDLKHSIKKLNYEDVSQIYSKIMRKLNVVYINGGINTNNYKQFTTDIKDLCKSGGIIIE